MTFAFATHTSFPRISSIIYAAPAFIFLLGLLVVPLHARAIGFQVDSSSTLMTSLVAYYKLADRAESYIGDRSLDLTDHGSVDFSQSGIIDKSADGGSTNTTKWLDTTANVSVGSGAYSISGWVLFNGPPTSTTDYPQNIWRTIAEVGGSNGNNYHLAFNNSDNGHRYLVAQRNYNTGSGGYTHISDYTAYDAMTSGVWYHVALTYDGTTLKMYFNGQFKDSLTDTSTPNEGANQGLAFLNGVNISSDVGHPLSARVSEFGFWNKVLSPTEVSDLYNNGQGNTLLTGPHIAPGVLYQYNSDAITVVSEGNTITGNTVVFGSQLMSGATTTVQLQVELATSTANFNGQVSVSSSPVSSGSFATTTPISNLVNGSYYWRARAVDSQNSSSTWQEFGTAGSVDFIIAPPATTSSFAIDTNGTLTTDFVEHWNGRSLTGSFSSNVLTNNNSVAIGASGGRIDKAFDFGASNTTRSLSTSTPLGFGGTTSFTFAGWVKSSGTVENDGRLWTMETATPNDTFATIMVNPSACPNRDHVQFRRSGTDNSVVCDSIDLDDAAWHFVAMRWDGSTITGNIDTRIAVAVSSTQISGWNDTAAFAIGRNSYADVQHWSGLMSGLGFWKKKLSDTEITDLYNSGKGNEFAHFLSGAITTSTTWTVAKSPYIVTSTATIATGTTVTVEPGAIIKFKDDKDLVVNGTLDVRGTTSSLAYFTSIHDDSAGGDTNGNGTGTSPSAGKWGNIQINSAGSSTLAGAVMRYGGASSTASDANVYNNGGMLTVRYSDISKSGHYGFSLDAGTTTINYSQIHNNIAGITVSLGNVTMASSSVFNNSSSSVPGVGVVQSNSPTSTMENNFWGGWTAADQNGNPGPFHSGTNSTGTGDSVSDNYVDFGPYVKAYLYNPSDTNTSPPAVNDFMMLIGGSTKYATSGWHAAIDEWNAATSSLIVLATSSAPTSSLNVVVFDDYATSSPLWAGMWDVATDPPTIRLNTFVLDSYNALEKQKTMMHELGHALGLAHSGQSGNVMATGTIEQDYLGPQDYHDYNFRWGDWWAEIWSSLLQ